VVQEAVLLCEQAVCCSDGVHCCPEGTTCDLSQGSCLGAGSSLTQSWAQIRRTVLRAPGAVTEGAGVGGDVVCPGHHSTCPQDMTCCLGATGQYGCCPFPKVSNHRETAQNHASCFLLCADELLENKAGITVTCTNVLFHH
jgi:hypothetical protein